MAQVIIVGGGISGLATAWFLKRRGISCSVFEAEAEVGGTARTIERDGYLVDIGPTSTLARGSAIFELIDELGLADEVVQANPRAPRYVVKDDRLIPLPRGLIDFATTPLFSRAAKWRVLAEPFRRRSEREESIAEFTTRRLGPEFLDWAIDPFVSGVYAGDPARLSVRAAVPKVYALEAAHGSLFIGALAKSFGGRAASAGPRGRLISFQKGMQTLPRAIAAQLPSIRTGVGVTAIAPVAAGWVVRTANGEEHRAARVVLAVPAFVAARLLRALLPQIAATLDKIAYAPVVSVALGFRKSQFKRLPEGFGALFPRRTGRKTLGIIFSSSLFPGRAPVNDVLLTAFVGGMKNPNAVELKADAVIDGVCADVAAVLGLHDRPRFAYVSSWPQAIPQYDLGHLQRVAQIRQGVDSLPGLHLRANWCDGVSFADSITNASVLAASL